MFSILHVDEIAELSSNMDVNIESSDSGTFDLLKDLECDRHDLYIKQRDNALKPQSEIVEDDKHSESPLPVEWLQEENSDTDDFILVMSKKES
jgi:hypothetical protein